MLRNFTKLPVLRYLGICNILCTWNVQAIPTYRVYRLYDSILVTNGLKKNLVCPDLILTISKLFRMWFVFLNKYKNSYVKSRDGNTKWKLILGDIPLNCVCNVYVLSKNITCLLPTFQNWYSQICLPVYNWQNSRVEFVSLNPWSKLI